MFKLVTLDVNGTLLKLKKPVGDIYAAAGKSVGVVADPEKLTTYFEQNFDNMNIKHPNFGQSSGLGWENWWKCLVIKTFKSSMNVPEEDKSYDRSLESVGRLLGNFFAQDGWKLSEGSVDFLRCLKSKGIYTGVISNFDPRLHSILENLQVIQFFSFVITSYEAGVMKPDIRIFKMAESAYEKNIGNKLACSDILHIGDSLKRDYLGARRAGWNAALIDHNCLTVNGKTENLDIKDIFPNLSEIQKHFFK